MIVSYDGRIDGPAGRRPFWRSCIVIVFDAELGPGSRPQLEVLAVVVLLALDWFAPVLVLVHETSTVAQVVHSPGLPSALQQPWKCYSLGP